MSSLLSEIRIFYLLLYRLCTPNEDENFYTCRRFVSKRDWVCCRRVTMSQIKFVYVTGGGLEDGCRCSK